MNLYHIQDHDRPMYVVAPDWMSALENWKERMAVENEIGTGDVEEPLGIMLVCEDGDLID